MKNVLFALLAIVPVLPAYGANLTDTTELAARIAEGEAAILVDAESAELYARAHIPGAVNLHYLDLEDADENAKTGLPIFPQLAASKFGALGIANDNEVVVYDSGNGRAASAVWYMLRFIGHERVSLLDGGFRKWLKEGRALSQTVPAPEKVVYKPQPKKEWALPTAELDQGDRLMVDARSIAEYSGKEDGGARRGGHIPGAVSLPWDRLSGELQTFADEAVMRTVLEEAGITPDREVVTYCNPGIGRSTFLYAALKRLGYDKVRVYPGSWNEWAADTARPIER